MPDGIILSVYIIASVLFILSLGGLSHPESARRGNVFGMAGMAIAIVATIFSQQAGHYPVIIAMMAVGGAIGAAVAQRVQMTAMPQLVALLHSLVGLAAVLIGVANYLDPAVDHQGVDQTIHEVEIFLGVLIGAVTFTGSVAAFGTVSYTHLRAHET